MVRSVHWMYAAITKCPCTEHECSNIDEYVEQGFHCEDCFREHVEITE